MAEIAVVDRRQLRGDREDRKRAGRQIIQSFKLFGLFYLMNHGIDPNLRRRFFELLYGYARLPEEVRQRHVVPGSWGQRGWASGEKSMTEGGVMDHKGWFFCNPVPFTSVEEEARLRQRWPILYPPNYWPEEMPAGLPAAYLAYAIALHEADVDCQHAAALALDLPEETFTDRLINGPHNSRALIYWPLTPEMIGKTAWGGSHTDYNDHTTLGGGIWVTPDGQLTEESPDKASGLYLQTPDGEWISGQAPAGCITIQCGQQKEILLGGEVIATPHVIRPPNVPDWLRLAMAHFGHQHTDGVAAPLPGFDGPAQMADYGPPRLIGTYDMITLHQIGLSGMTDQQMVASLGYRYDLLTQRLSRRS